MFEASSQVLSVVTATCDDMSGHLAGGSTVLGGQHPERIPLDIPIKEAGLLASSHLGCAYLQGCFIHPPCISEGTASDLVICVRKLRWTLGHGRVGATSWRAIVFVDGRVLAEQSGHFDGNDEMECIRLTLAPLPGGMVNLALVSGPSSTVFIWPALVAPPEVRLNLQHLHSVTRRDILREEQEHMADNLTEVVAFEGPLVDATSRTDLLVLERAWKESLLPLLVDLSHLMQLQHSLTSPDIKEGCSTEGNEGSVVEEQGQMEDLVVHLLTYLGGHDLWATVQFLLKKLCGSSESTAGQLAMDGRVSSQDHHLSSLTRAAVVGFAHPEVEHDYQEFKHTWGATMDRLGPLLLCAFFSLFWTHHLSWSRLLPWQSYYHEHGLLTVGMLMRFVPYILMSLFPKLLERRRAYVHVVYQLSMALLTCCAAVLFLGTRSGALMMMLSHHWLTLPLLQGMLLPGLMQVSFPSMFFVSTCTLLVCFLSSIHLGLGPLNQLVKEYLATWLVSTMLALCLEVWTRRAFLTGRGHPDQVTLSRNEGRGNSRGRGNVIAPASVHGRGSSGLQPTVAAAKDLAVATICGFLDANIEDTFVSSRNDFGVLLDRLAAALYLLIFLLHTLLRTFHGGLYATSTVVGSMAVVRLIRVIPALVTSLGIRRVTAHRELIHLLADMGVVLVLFRAVLSKSTEGVAFWWAVERNVVFWLVFSLCSPILTHQGNKDLYSRWWLMVLVSGPSIQQVRFWRHLPLYCVHLLGVWAMNTRQDVANQYGASRLACILVGAMACAFLLDAVHRYNFCRQQPTPSIQQMDQPERDSMAEKDHAE